ncbi:monoacylglycerol lipase ABHD12 isoform X2 [Anoplophora glabripennis]|uniref:monoacylglycerol lipase ABHD12 isoform X2 n=1 Tax=Anoplophora glabripennis TaxID=217634 RepID=UPI000875333F|nr:monoacylglycerol lipase ABHD12 isoform X2 [Anoplophora glabripennis]
MKNNFWLQNTDPGESRYIISIGTCVGFQKEDLSEAFTTCKVFTIIFTAIFVILPLIFKYSYKLQSAVVFLNFLHIPINADYEHPEKYGLENARNFYLLTDDNIKIGVWQILHQNITSSTNYTDDQYYEDILGNGENVIIYHHGNAGTRLTPHRIELYKFLRKYFHVIAFDYRSYGDSSNVDPSEPNIVKDCMFVFKWVANRTNANIFIWGHSLGTSLATQSVVQLQNQGYKPTGLILEAPFNNMREEISEFPLAGMFKYLPWFTYTVVEPMQANGFTFQTDKFICNVDAPIIILHAEDDHVVPYKLGYKLYQNALRCRQGAQGKLLFVKFDEGHNYNHKFICRAPELHDIISNFICEAISECREKKLLTV